MVASKEGKLRKAKAMSWVKNAVLHALGFCAVSQVSGFDFQYFVPQEFGDDLPLRNGSFAQEVISFLRATPFPDADHERVDSGFFIPAMLTFISTPLLTKINVQFALKFLLGAIHMTCRSFVNDLERRLHVQPFCQQRVKQLAAFVLRQYSSLKFQEISTSSAMSFCGGSIFVKEM